MNLVLDRKEQSTNLILYRPGRSLRDLAQQGETRLSLAEGYKGLLVIFSEHSIYFPITQALATNYLKLDGIRVSCVPHFVDVNVGENVRTAIRLVVETS